MSAPPTLTVLTESVFFVGCLALLIVLAAKRLRQLKVKKVTPATVRAALAHGRARSAFAEFVRQLYPWPPPSTPLAVEASLERCREKLECLALFESALATDEQTAAQIRILKPALASLLTMIEQDGTALDKASWRRAEFDIAACRFQAVRAGEHHCVSRDQPDVRAPSDSGGRGDV